MLLENERDALRFSDRTDDNIKVLSDKSDRTKQIRLISQNVNRGGTTLTSEQLGHTIKNLTDKTPKYVSDDVRDPKYMGSRSSYPHSRTRKTQQAHSNRDFTRRGTVSIESIFNIYIAT